MKRIDLDEFLDHASNLWEKRDRGPGIAALIMRVIKARFCEWCGDLLIQKDPRIRFCNHSCAMRSWQLSEKKIKEKRNAA